MATETFVLPGDSLDPELLPSHPTLPLRLGPGLRHIPPSTITPTVAGQLCTDARKNAVWVEYNGGRYIPTIGDLVIATVQRSAVDVYYASISDFTSAASLPQLSFEGATKKTRPQLSSGSLVYARITLANKHMDPELECVSSSTGKSEGLGPLTGGMLFDVSLGMARRLMMTKPVEQGRVVVLEELGGLGVAFEIAVGRNGKVWVDSKNTKSTLAVGRAIQETDEKGLKIEEQKKLARKLVKDL
ncbi:putative exosome complex exonuclease RRP40 [Coleophoma cylindrospora]|uniref:Ribosomal RNA-processing protein 40 n=1 Tax=Coleophoma cylindrospora TaxID=1849047 RepID=A0A3D8RUQ5_9HELO|nr:putative exosome complex exonuclease RRP40 [Coleophoma cylindrospora]